MQTTYRVEVTQEDIDKGQPGISWDCAFARGLKRVRPNDDIIVGTEVLWYGAHKPMRLVLDEEASRFIRDFDEGRRVSPQSFQLELEA